MSGLSRFFMEDQTEHLCVMIQQMVNRHIRTLIWLMKPSSPHPSLCRAIADMMAAFLNAQHSIAHEKSSPSSIAPN
ncbi:hypothetical protein V8B97DRAFT_1980447 [Scleroderma yunnanense]